MEIVLPKLETIIFQESGSKNIIKQFLGEQPDLPLNIVESSRSFIVINHDNKNYFFANSLEKIPAAAQYAILTNVTPSKLKFESNQIKLKSWLKHPLIKKHSVSEIIASWKNDFFYKQEDVLANDPGLRQPQIAALHMVIGHLKLPLDAATVVMPTGTGKTETMLSALVANQCPRLLVTVPSDSLRNQISDKFYSLGLLKKFGVIGKKSLYPIVGIIKNKFASIQAMVDFVEKCNVVVTTMDWLTDQPEAEKKKMSEIFSQIFIDEAHHVKAHSWNEFRNTFEKEKVIQFTATPFRNDGKRLDGKMISNFPLRKAQEQGYYKKIKFFPIREYDNELADKQIADLAIVKLRADIAAGYNHILMARCATKQRADDIFKLYESQTDLNPVVIYSNITGFKEIFEKIVNKHARIIVCVDMLGEGFDLPELKIAAFHDIRRSLPITLQLAGRFTRTKYDEQLGDASFIANIADLEVRDELADLYAYDADWNEILSDSSYERINEQVEFKDFIEGFTKLSDSNVPFQNIKPKLSTVVYKNKTNGWFPTNFHKGISGYENFDYKFSDLNSDQKVLVIITGKRMDVDWVHIKDIYEFQWTLTIVFWDTINNLLFINSSDNSSLYTELAQAIIGENAEIIKGVNVFKSFYNIKRVKLQNVGLRQFLGKNIRFRMMMGSDVGEALSIAEKARGEKAFVMGTGFENGNPVNIGASYKGRIWTKLIGDLKDYRNWCLALGKKLINDSIDANQILKETLIPQMVTSIPPIFPVWIDWDIDMYLDTEIKYKFYINGFYYDLSTADLELLNPSAGGDLLFSIVGEDRKATFKLLLSEDDVDGEKYPKFEIIQQTPETVEVHYGSKVYTGKQFFENYIPTIWFADGSALTGNEYIELKQSMPIYPKEEIIAWDWTGVNLSCEAQGVNPKKTDSIQYNVIQRLIAADYDIVYDDDYSGEIADVLAIKSESDKISIKMYHLKYASGGVVSNQIKNLYEVCGQAQKSVHWKHKSGKELINHLLRRENKNKKGIFSSRLEKGSQADLVKMLTVIKNEIPISFEIYIVQPAISKANPSNEILTLLGVTESFVKEFADINLKVIASA